MPTHKHLKVETYGRKSGRNHRFPHSGSHLWDRKAGTAMVRTPVIDGQIGSAPERTDIVRFTHGSSKSSWTAREWFFVLMLPGLQTSFLPVACRCFSSHLACGPCTEEIDAACIPALRSRNFLPLDRPKSNAVHLDGNERATPPPGSKSSLRFIRPHRSPAPGPIS